MFQFIVTNILMVSFGTVLYLVVRTLPRIEETGEPEKRGLLERWVTSEMPEKVDITLKNFLIKFLRRFRVVVLKLDNSVTKHLKKIQPEADPSDKLKPTIDFKEMTSGKNGESEEIVA